MVEEHDKRLVGALNLLKGQLDPLIEQLLAGELGQQTRDALATNFRDMADDLNRIVAGAADPAGGEQRTPPWPGWPTRGRFSVSGP